MTAAETSFHQMGLNLYEDQFLREMMADYEFSCEKGQRIYGPPKEWTAEPPEHGCEVFIGHIPRDCLESELLSVFAKIGKIYQFRLMMDSPNSNRGFGFCCYCNKEDTKRAMEELNNFEIRPGKTIGVQLSVDNCKLFVGGIPTNKKRDEILDEMRKVTEQVKDVIVYPSIEDKNKNRGFAFVEYLTHRAATIARQKLQKAPFKLWNKICHVDWAEPEPQVSDEIMSKVTNLHARNLLDETTEDDIRRVFIEASGGDSNAVVKVRKLKDCAFIHFKDRETADLARTKLNNTCFDGGVEIEVNWAKPDQKKLSQDGKTHGVPRKIFNPQEIYELPSLLAAAQFPHPQLLTQQLINYPACALASLQNDLSSRNYRRNATGMKTVIPANHRKHPIELQQTATPPLQIFQYIDNYCTILGMERPQYTTMMDPETSQTVPRYCAEVVLPGTAISYTTPGYYASVDEAMIACAQALFAILTSPAQIMPTDTLLSYVGLPSASTGNLLFNPLTLPTPIMGMPMSQQNSGAGSVMDDLGNQTLGKLNTSPFAFQHANSLNTLFPAPNPPVSNPQNSAFMGMDSLTYAGLYDGSLDLNCLMRSGTPVQQSYLPANFHIDQNQLNMEALKFHLQNPQNSFLSPLIPAGPKLVGTLVNNVNSAENAAVPT